jgi:hypothetical protein
VRRSDPERTIAGHDSRSESIEGFVPARFTLCPRAGELFAIGPPYGTFRAPIEYSHVATPESKRGKYDPDEA